jgi:hypothetical protein
MQVRAYVSKEDSQYVVTLEVDAKELGVDAETELHLHWVRFGIRGSDCRAKQAIRTLSLDSRFLKLVDLPLVSAYQNRSQEVPGHVSRRQKSVVFHVIILFIQGLS